MTFDNPPCPTCTHAHTQAYTLAVVQRLTPVQPHSVRLFLDTSGEFVYACLTVAIFFSFRIVLKPTQVFDDFIISPCSHLSLRIHLLPHGCNMQQGVCSVCCSSRATLGVGGQRAPGSCLMFPSSSSEVITCPRADAAGKWISLGVNVRQSTSEWDVNPLVWKTGSTALVLHVVGSYTWYMHLESPVWIDDVRFVTAQGLIRVIIVSTIIRTALYFTFVICLVYLFVLTIYNKGRIFC